MRYLIYDTETTGRPSNYNAPISDTDNWPRLVQLAWQIHNEKGELLENHNLIVKPDGFTIPFNAAQVHGITTEKALAKGKNLESVINLFLSTLTDDTMLVAHNAQFDVNIVGSELFRLGKETDFFMNLPTFDTMLETTEFTQIPGGRGGGYKWPSLSELHQKLFGKPFDEAHNAAADVNATARSFFEVIRINGVPSHKANFTPENFEAFKTIFNDVIQPFDIEIGTQIAEKNATTSTKLKLKSKEELDIDIDSPFFHFHNHTSFSILTATSKVEDLIQRAVDENMPAVGMTDLGNMMGAFAFISAAEKINKNLENPITPIIGCEIYTSDRYQQLKFTKDNPDKRYTQVLLAKNKNGYHNLAKISSTGYTEGYYMGYPRVGKEVIVQYKEDLIATTGSLSSEIPNLILNVGEHQAEDAFLWWKETFGEDFYVELIRHGLDEENHVNEILLNLAKKHDVKVLAQNNTFYLDQSESEAHDILLCVRDGEKKATQIGRGRDFRFGFPNNEFYFKSQAQMVKLFEDIPEAITNFKDFIKKFESYTLAQDVLLPKFDIPDEFKDPQDEIDGGVRGENAYLRHLTYEGAKKRYSKITDDIIDRLDFELKTIENTGYPGYFLIVQDFTSQARKMGVSVGPGRGSAAGSAVAYCIGITNVDPIKYDLLFERFLNPDRVSLPDIDIDFDDRGREDIIRWVVDKYGSSNVAQIITYGTMAGKSAVRDTGRVLDLPLPDTDRIAKKIHTKLNKLFKMNDKDINSKFNGDEINDCKEILKIATKDDLEARTINQAKVIEGSIRNTGVHACGVIITPTDIRELIPIAVAKERSNDDGSTENQIVTQFDNSVVENAGLLKMDFLGLKTLTIIKDAVALVKETQGIDLAPDDFPLDDEKTYEEIFKKGRTTAIFQYESAGMQKHLKALKPDKFDDLIAMNALYRPGPLQYIPNFIARKHGTEEITYDLPEMEEYLAETYGITVYQEQVMLLSQKLANFTKGEADVLRKAMGKKQMDTLAKMEGKFMDQAMANGHDEKILKKIWEDWKAFAQYAFNKSHSTCYAYVAFQTAYLKAHYPAELMAATLSNNMKNIKDISFHMQECKRMGIDVLSPDVNESNLYFNVNKKGAIRFGLGAVKGVGQGAVESIVKEREENGRFKSIFDFVKRVDLTQCNKRTIENLIYAGAFDEVDEIHRGRYFFETDGSTAIEKIIKFGQASQKGGDENQFSLFGEATMQESIQEPFIPDCEKWPVIQKLNKEKEVVGIYISSHPLDKYHYAIKNFTNITLDQLKGNEERLIGRPLKVAGMITEVNHMISSKDGREFGKMVIEDYTESHEFMLFGEDYLKLKYYLEKNLMVLLNLNITKNKWSGRTYVNISDMQLLSDVMEKQAKSLNIEIDASSIDSDFLNIFLKLIKSHLGDKDLNIEFRYDNQKFASKSSSLKVNICQDLLNELNELSVISFKLN